MKIHDLKTLINNKWINTISWMIVAYYFLIILNSVFQAVTMGFSHPNLNIEILLEINGEIFPKHALLLVVPFVVCSFMLFSRQWYPIFLALALLISSELNLYFIIDSVLHPLLFETGIYNFLLRPGQNVLNPQYTKVMLFLFFIVIFTLLMFFKKYRSVDRTFSWLIITSVFLTTMIFHFAFPMGIFKYAKVEHENRLVWEITNLDNSQICESNKNCLITDHELNIKKSDFNLEFNLYEKYPYFFKGAKQYLAAYPDKNYYVQSLGSFDGPRFDYIIAGVKKIKKDNKEEFLFIMNTQVMKPYGRSSENWFSFLCVCAHSIWIIGGYFLLYLHKAVFFKRKKISE